MTLTSPVQPGKNKHGLHWHSADCLFFYLGLRALGGACCPNGRQQIPHFCFIIQTNKIMKRTFIVTFTTLTTVLLTVSCTSLLGPKHADSRYLKGWIFRTCIDNDYRNSCVEDFGSTYYNFSTPPETLNDACIAFLAECTEDNYWEDKYEECKAAILNDARDIIDRDQNIFDCLFSTYHDDKIVKVFRQDPDMTISTLSTMVDRFFAYIENMAQEQVSIINWEYNKDALADLHRLSDRIRNRRRFLCIIGPY